MKKIGLYLLLLLVTVQTGVVAQTLKDVVNPETPITWLGLDFSLLKVVADQDAWGKTPNEYFKAWNALMINEQEKYNIAEALDREQVKFALDVAIDHNDALLADNLFIQQSSPDALAKVSDVPSVINSYDFKNHTGIGVILIAKSFDKPAARGYWWITFVNMETKEIVFVQEMNAGSSGFGLRNYWASTVYYVLKQIRSKEYKKWSKSVKFK